MELKPNLKLYHGSVFKFDTPNLNKGLKAKDFGKGFYLISDPTQATNFIYLKSRRSLKKVGYLYTFQYIANQDLDIIRFTSADYLWLSCIISNRVYSLDNCNNYDIIIGKVADDKTYRVLNNYLMGDYGEPHSSQAIDMAIKSLRPLSLTDQFCFKTQRSLNSLQLLSIKEFSIL